MSSSIQTRSARPVHLRYQCRGVADGICLKICPNFGMDPKNTRHLYCSWCPVAYNVQEKDLKFVTRLDWEKLNQMT
jgi:hypothetical protein